MTGQEFLSSSEAQHVVNSLWRGDWVQQNDEDDEILYVAYEKSESNRFWRHFNPQRMAVPRYQSAFKIVVWALFLFGAPRGHALLIDSLLADCPKVRFSR